jgi:DNA repair exonuclease SbcCD nuclease subunit
MTPRELELGRMGRKILLSSDWHGDKRTLGVSRIDDVRTAVRQTVDAAVTHKVDLYVFLGDLCDPDSGPIVLRCAEIAVQAACDLQEAGIDSLWLAGNHDVFEDSTGCTSLAPLRALPSRLPGMGRVTVAERPLVFTKQETAFMCLPYVATSHPYSPEQFAREQLDALDADMRVVVLGHLHLAGIIPGEETHEMGRGRDLFYPHKTLDEWKEDPGNNPSVIYEANGHYHEPQLYAGVHVPGALVRFTFADVHEPSFILVDLEGVP